MFHHLLGSIQVLAPVRYHIVYILDKYRFKASWHCPLPPRRPALSNCNSSSGSSPVSFIHINLFYVTPTQESLEELAASPGYWDILKYVYAFQTLKHNGEAVVSLFLGLRFSACKLRQPCPPGPVPRTALQNWREHKTSRCSTNLNRWVEVVSEKAPPCEGVCTVLRGTSNAISGASRASPDSEKGLPLAKAAPGPEICQKGRQESLAARSPLQGNTHTHSPTHK